MNSFRSEYRRSAGRSPLAVRVGLALLVLVLASASPRGGPAAPAARAETRPVKVMTRNLYLGADLAPVYTATSLADLASKATQVFTTVQATDFPARAKVLAKEIQSADPDLIGLQEVSLWRRGELGVLDGPTTPATIVVYDYLALLQQELAARGLQYAVMVQQFTGDGEVPSTLGYDLRLTQRNVILGKAGLPADELTVTNPQAATYATNLTIPTVAGPITDRRGWLAVEATVNKRSFRFITTHLDSTVPAIAAAQASELASGPANTTLPVVLVGDLNSEPRDAAPSAYVTLTGAGFVDTWPQANGSAAGLTCCNDEYLLNPVPTFTKRIDDVLTKPAVTVVAAKLVGTDPDNRTPSGLWPSDHAGIIATVAP